MLPAHRLNASCAPKPRHAPVALENLNAAPMIRAFRPYGYHASSRTLRGRGTSIDSTPRRSSRVERSVPQKRTRPVQRAHHATHSRRHSDVTRQADLPLRSRRIWSDRSWPRTHKLASLHRAAQNTHSDSAHVSPLRGRSFGDSQAPLRSRYKGYTDPGRRILFSWNSAKAKNCNRVAIQQNHE